MSPPRFRGGRGAATLILYAVLTTMAAAQNPPPAARTPPAAGPTATEGTLTLDLEVTAKKLNEARINIEPRIGASTYTLNKDAIEDVSHRLEAAPGGPVYRAACRHQPARRELSAAQHDRDRFFANQYGPRRSAFLGVTKEL